MCRKARATAGLLIKLKIFPKHDSESSFKGYIIALKQIVVVAVCDNMTNKFRKKSFYFRK